MTPALNKKQQGGDTPPCKTILKRPAKNNRAEISLRPADFFVSEKLIDLRRSARGCRRIYISIYQML